jgi:hypothetical protein
VGAFADELHGTRTERPQDFKGDCAERVTRTLVVCRVVPALFRVLESSGMAGGGGGGTNIRNSLGVDERDVH